MGKKQHSDKVSVIIPTYNRKGKLLRAINSVVKQTYNPYEIIVVDDKSDFDINCFLEASINHPLKVIRKKKNTGPSESRNIGVASSEGDYIAFLDSDDYWDTKKLEKQLKEFEKDKQLGLVYCDTFIVKKTVKL